MKKLLLTCLLALSCGLPALAEWKVAVVDTGKAFDAYFRTKEMATQIAARGTAYTKELQDLKDDYQRASYQAQQLEAAAKNTSSAANVRKQNDAALAQKVVELKSMENDLKKMSAQRKHEIEDELVRRHVQICEAIMKVIIDYAKSQSYDLVLDSTAQKRGTSIIPFDANKVQDITGVIITRLNAQAR